MTGWTARRVAAWGQPEPDATARLLQPLSWVYGALIAGRRLAYRRGWLKAQSAPVPVLVIGNLIVGGAGKTPAVIAAIPRLQALGFRPGIVSRGHGRTADGDLPLEVLPGMPASTTGDEPLLLRLRTGVPVVVGRDRAAAARWLCEHHPAVNLIVADDGLQHLRLARDAALIVFDDRGAGNGLLLPAGPLREPVPAQLPANCRVLYSGGRRSTHLAGAVGHRRLVPPQPLRQWWLGQSSEQPESLGASGAAGITAAGGSWATWSDRPVLAAAGLARPQAFFDLLAEQGLQVQGLPLADHAALNPPPWRDRPDLARMDLLVTEKDAIKLAPDDPANQRVWVVPLDFQPEPAFDDDLRALCQPLLPRSHRLAT